MGFISGLLGTSNNFQAQAPVNTFQGQNANYVPGIQNAMGSAQGLGNAGQGLISSLQAQMGGGGASVAQELLRRQTDSNNAGFASAIASQRGMNPGLAQKLILDQQAHAQQQSAGQGATLRAQEMLGTQGLLAGAIQGQQANQTGLLGTLAGANQGQNVLGMQQAMGNQQANLDTQRINAGVAGQNAQTNAGLVGGLMGGAGAAIGMTGGGQVPGQAPVTGDSEKNDTVPAMLSPGEVVLPRSVADDPDKAAAFVRAIRRQKQGPDGYGKALSKMRDLDGRLKAVEEMCRGGLVGSGLMSDKESSRVQKWAGGQV